MTSAIHFKMKSEKDFSTLSFDGDFLKVSDLKLLVVEKRKLNYGDGFDLVITDAQTNEEYTDETTLIPKNTSVVIKRVPGQKPGGILSQQTLARRNERYAEKDLVKGANTEQHSSGDKTKRVASNSGWEQPREVEGEGEDERINSVVDSSTVTFTQRPRFNQHNPVFDRPPPPNYRCHRCGKPGHWIHHCPTNGDPNFDIVRVRRPTGIPRSMLQSVEAPVRGTGLRTPGGEFVTLKPNQDEFSRRTAALRRMVEQRQVTGNSRSEAGNVDNGTLTWQNSKDEENAFVETKKELSPLQEDVIRNEFENKSNYQEQETCVCDQVGGSLSAVATEMKQNMDSLSNIVDSVTNASVSGRETNSSYNSLLDVSHYHSELLEDMSKSTGNPSGRPKDSVYNKERNSESNIWIENVSPPWLTEKGEHIGATELDSSTTNDGTYAPLPSSSSSMFHPYMSTPSFPMRYPNMASIPWPFGVYPFPCFGNNFHSMTSQYVPEDTTNLEWNPPNTVEEPKSNDSRKPKRKSSEKSSSHSSSEQKADSRERTHKRSKPQHRR